MFFSLKEANRLLGLTPIEMLFHVAGVTVFSIFFVLKVESVITNFNWWLVFAPLFAADGVHFYFVYLVLLRMLLAGMYKAAPLRALWSCTILGLHFAFKFLLCKKLSGQLSMDYAEVLAPIMIMLQLFMIRACQIH